MRDEIDDRIFQAARHQFGEHVEHLLRSMGYAFERLTARLYDAPWSRRPGTVREKRFTVL